MTDRTVRWGEVTRGLDKRKDIFIKLYYNDKLSLREVADRMGVSFGALTKWANKQELPRRSLSEARAVKMAPRMTRLGRDRDTIARLRLDAKLTLEEIAEKCGYKNRSTVHKMLKSAGLDGELDTLPSLAEWRQQQAAKAKRARTRPKSKPTAKPPTD